MFLLNLYELLRISRNSGVYSISGLINGLPLQGAFFATAGYFFLAAARCLFCHCGLLFLPLRGVFLLLRCAFLLLRCAFLPLLFFLLLRCAFFATAWCDVQFFNGNTLTSLLRSLWNFQLKCPQISFIFSI